jgi:hypothetical protein
MKNPLIIKRIAWIALVFNFLIWFMLFTALIRDLRHLDWLDYSGAWIICVFLFLFFIPFIYISQVLSLINTYFPDQEISRPKMNWILVLFIFQLLAVLLDILVLVAYLWNFKEVIGNARQPYASQNLAILIIMILLTPLNILVAFTGKRLSRIIRKNYNDGLFINSDLIR